MLSSRRAKRKRKPPQLPAPIPPPNPLAAVHVTAGIINLAMLIGMGVDAYHQVATTGTWHPTEWEMALFLSATGVVALKKSQPKTNNSAE